LEKGTTYNAYLIFGETHTALVDASHEKFNNLFMKTLQEQLQKAGRSIDYILVRPARAAVTAAAAAAAAVAAASFPAGTKVQHRLVAMATNKRCLYVSILHTRLLLCACNTSVLQYAPIPVHASSSCSIAA